MADCVIVIDASAPSPASARASPSPRSPSPSPAPPLSPRAAAAQAAAAGPARGDDAVSSTRGKRARTASVSSSSASSRAASAEPATTAARPSDGAAALPGTELFSALIDEANGLYEKMVRDGQVVQDGASPASRKRKSDQASPPLPPPPPPSLPVTHKNSLAHDYARLYDQMVAATRRNAGLVALVEHLEQDNRRMRQIITQTERDRGLPAAQPQPLPVVAPAAAAALRHPAQPQPSVPLPNAQPHNEPPGMLPPLWALVSGAPAPAQPPAPLPTRSTPPAPAFSEPATSSAAAKAAFASLAIFDRQFSKNTSVSPPPAVVPASLAPVQPPAANLTYPSVVAAKHFAPAAPAPMPAPAPVSVPTTVRPIREVPPSPSSSLPQAARGRRIKFFPYKGPAVANPIAPGTAAGGSLVYVPQTPAVAAEVQ